ncbi:MAG: TetR/AcrR family transcriptional regulator [Pseudomonadota bacterium]
MTSESNLEHTIVDAALSLAEDKDWESVRLYQVAEKLDISLDEIRLYFREKEDIIDAWFDRADQAMLRTCGTESFEHSSSPEKLHRLLMSWLTALQQHRRVTRQMILGKLEPGHIHYQVQGLLRVSRTVQWLREAAGLSSTLPWRAIEETALTALYLVTFAKWMCDDTEDNRSTSRFLQNRLNSACWLCTYSDHRDESGADIQSA